MKVLKKILFVILLLVLILNAIIIITGSTYIYKGIANTYLKGRIGPDIDEYRIFENREVKSGTPLPLPNAHDYNAKQIDTKSFEPYGTVAYLILQNDSVKYEQYWDGYGSESVSNSFSMAKSFVGILVGCALQDGYIKSIDQPVGDFLPTFKQGPNAQLTIRHLLTMSSGIDFDENYTSPFAYPAAAYYGNDIIRLTNRYKVTEEPGKTFKYLSGNTELLALLLEKAASKKLSNYMSERLWQPLGASKSAYWSLDHKDGMEKAYCCFNSNARDFARFGLLYLHQGNWHGKQLVPESYVQEATRPAPTLTPEGQPNKSYGFQWWILHYKNLDLPYCRGILGQYIIVVPQKNMVIVRLGHKRDKVKEGDTPIDLFLYIDKAFQSF